MSKTKEYMIGYRYKIGDALVINNQHRGFDWYTNDV